MGGSLLLDAVLQCLSRVECREPGRRDLDALSGLGIATFAGFTLPRLERSESSDLDPLPGHESGRDQTFLSRGEKRVDGGARFACRKSRLLCNRGDELSLVHSIHPLSVEQARVKLRRTPGGVKQIHDADAVFRGSERVLNTAEAAQAA